VPANLTQQYKDAEARFRAAASHADKVDALREMLALLPKHKGTEKLHADLKKRLAKLEDEGERAARSAPHRGPEPGRVAREGAGQWVLLGPPNAGKSALLAALTHAHPEIADWPFTTRAAQPGMMAFEDVQVQLVDTPAAAAGHVEPWLPNLVRGADGVVVVLDPEADDAEAGMRAVRDVLERARVRPEARPAAPGASPLEVAHPVVVVTTRRDEDPDGTFAALAREAVGEPLPSFPVSTVTGEGLEPLREALWRGLRRIRVHTKEPGHPPDPGKPFVLPAGATVEDLARLVHRELAERVKFARVWGHAKFDGQQVDRHHVLADRDVVELHA
jgi:ribosome-interacting GTPase 1